MKRGSCPQIQKNIKKDNYIVTKCIYAKMDRHLDKMHKFLGKYKLPELKKRQKN